MSELSAGLYLAALIILALVIWQLKPSANLATITLLAILLAFFIHQTGLGGWQKPASSETIMTTSAPAPIIVTATAAPHAVPVVAQGTANWSQVPGNVARWQANILLAVGNCELGLVTDSYDAGLLMAAIVMQESSGNPNAIGKAHDTGLAQVVPNEHPDPMFRNRPSQAELLEPQFNLNYAACLLRDNIKRTGSVRKGLTAYNGSPTYPEHIYGHYARFTAARGGIQTVQTGLAVEAQNYRFTANPFTAFTITSHFRSHERPNHKGVDIVAKGDTTIRAVESGIVEWIGPFYCASDCLGPLAVVVNHGSWRTVYGHADFVYVNAGDVVYAGQALARQGALGNATGPHLHLEMRIGGRLWVNENGVAFVLDSQLVNPADYLK